MTLPKGSATIGFLHPGEVADCFFHSMAGLMMYDATHQGRFMSHDKGMMGKLAASGGIVEGRNKIAGEVVDSDVEWLLFIDSDMGFAPDTLERLIAAADPVERPVVGGLCFGHRADGPSSFHGIRYRIAPTVYDWVETDDEVGFVSRVDYERGVLVKASGTGCACLLVHRSALERVADKWGRVWFDMVRHPKGANFSEDLAFCVRLQSVDIPIYVDTSVKTTHKKGNIFLDEELYDQQMGGPVQPQSWKEPLPSQPIGPKMNRAQRRAAVQSGA